MAFDLGAYNRRLMWRAFAVGIAMQAAICGVVAYLWGDEGNRSEFFLLLFVALIVVGILNAFIGFLAKLVLQQWSNAEAYEALFIDDLRKMDVPPPGPSYQRSWYYLSQIADDDDYSAHQRVAAARLFADAKGMVGRLPFIQAMQCEKAFDSAVLRFASESPQREPV